MISFTTPSSLGIFDRKPVGVMINVYGTERRPAMQYRLEIVVLMKK